jgi:purine-binding chemotaxis protein CheW
MDYEHDDRPVDGTGDEPGTGDQAAESGLFGDEFAFEAPDLATAFLAALDAVDDRRFVTPPPPDPEPIAASPVSALEPGSLAMPAVEEQQVEEEADAYAAYAADATDEPFALAPGSLAMPAADAEGIEEQQGVEEQAADAYATYAAETNDGPFALEPGTLSLTESAEGSKPAEGSAYAASSDFAEIEVERAPEDFDIDLDAAYAAAARAAAAYDDPFAEPDASIEMAAAEIEIDEPVDLDAQAGMFEIDTADAAVEALSEATADAGGDAEAEADAGADPEVLEDLEEFVAFSLGDTRCVIPIRNVMEIGRIPDAVPVPNAPPWLHGLGNLRSQVLSLIDLRAFLGIGRVRPATGRMLVLRTDDEEVIAGLLVDHVHQIVSLSASRFHAVPETLPHHYVSHAWGVCDYGNFTMIGLDVDSLLGVENMESMTSEAV